MHIVRRKFLCFLPFFFLPGGWGGGRKGERLGRAAYTLVRHLKRVSGQSIYQCLYISHLQCSVLYETLYSL